MNRLTRSKLANQKKTEYVKAGKKAELLKKLGTKVRQSRLSKLAPVDEEPTKKGKAKAEEYLINIDSSETEEDTEEDTEQDTEEEINIRRKPRERSNTVLKRGAVQTTLKRSKTNNDLLELQKEIELLKLQQIKQVKKANKVKKDIHEITDKKGLGKQLNPIAQQLKQRMLVEF